MSTNPSAFGSGGGQQPYQFRPESYGAQGNGIVTADVTTNSTATITSPTVAASGKAGQYIMIHGANGSAAGPLITTIISITGTGAVLAAAAGASVANCPAVFGTDDTAAIAAAVNAAGTYALANTYFAEVLFGAKAYILATGPTQTGDGATTPTFNSQVPLPYPAANGTSQKLIIQLTGAGDAGHVQYWGSTTPSLAGTSLVSMATHGNTVDPTFGQQSVVGGPTSGAGFAVIAGNQAFANVKAVVKGIGIWLPMWTNIVAWNFGFVSQLRAQQASAHIFAPTGVNGGVQPYLQAIGNATFLGSIGVGWITPVNQNNDDIVMDDVSAEGYENGFRIYDHFSGGRMAAIYTDVAVNVQRGGGIGHMVSIANMSAESYNGGLLTNGTGAQTCAVDIMWAAENGAVTYDVSDTGNYLRGVFRYQDSADAGRGITVTGAANLKIISDQLGPGTWAGRPAVPATGVAQQNTSWRDAMVSVTGGTVSAVTVDGTAVGFTATGFTVLVPAGKNITLTYTVAPSWDWVLL